MAPDPRKSHFWYISGIKGSGKSEYARRLFYAYPYDRLVLDITHDVTSDMLVPDGIPHHQLTAPLPSSWPEWMRDDDDRDTDIPGAHLPGQMTLVFRPDMGSGEARDDIDRAVGLAMRGRGRPVLAWADEIGEVCTHQWTGPAMRRALHHGRHHDLSLLMCGPRAKEVNPLCVGQADTVVTFRTLNRHDRQALAGNMGVDQDEFDSLNRQLRKYEHMVWQRETEDLEVFAPLPRWRRGRDAPAEVPY